MKLDMGLIKVLAIAGVGYAVYSYYKKNKKSSDLKEQTRLDDELNMPQVSNEIVLGSDGTGRCPEGKVKRVIGMGIAGGFLYSCQDEGDSIKNNVDLRGVPDNFKKCIPPNVRVSSSTVYYSDDNKFYKRYNTVNKGMVGGAPPVEITPAEYKEAYEQHLKCEDKKNIKSVIK